MVIAGLHTQMVLGNATSPKPISLVISIDMWEALGYVFSTMAWRGCFQRKILSWAVFIQSGNE